MIGKSSIAGSDCNILNNFINKYNLNISHWLDKKTLLSKRFKKGHMEIYGTMWRQYQRHASKRKITFNISIKQAWQKFIDQNRKCALSGVLLIFKTTSRSKNGTASLDRIDSSKNYEIDNIQWIHKDLQKMKMNMCEKKFITWCKQIANYNN